MPTDEELDQAANARLPAFNESAHTSVPMTQQAQRTNGLAVASLVLGILWLSWIGSLLAVIFGHIGLNQINHSNGAQGGRGLAIAGLVLGYVGVGFLLLFIIAAAAGGGSTTY